MLVTGVIVHVMLHGDFPYTPEKQHREYMMMAIMILILQLTTTTNNNNYNNNNIYNK